MPDRIRALELSEADRLAADWESKRNIAWLMQQQAKAGALVMAEKVNSLLPNRAPILDTLASLQAASGKLPEAISTQQQAVLSSPRDANLQVTLARYLINAGKKSEARNRLERLERLGSGFARQSEVTELMRQL